MGKRVLTKAGDVFCVEIEGKFKCFFQYLIKDSTSLNGAVIRVFKHRYPMDYEPVIEEIIKGDVLFYAHTFLRVGLHFEAWSKVGNSKNFDLKCLERIYFGNKIANVIGDGVISNYWLVWQVDSEMIEFKNCEPSNEYINKMEIGAVFAYTAIVDRIQRGYYHCSLDEYDVLHRVPRVDVDSYVKHEFDGVMHYFHFYGADAVQEIAVHGDDVICRLDKEHPRCGDQELRQAKFWETNWRHDDFISQEEFDNKWNN